MTQNVGRMVIVPADSSFPLLAPPRCSGWGWMEFDRPSVRQGGHDIGTPDESMWAVIEIVIVEIVDEGSACARRHERIDVHVLVVKDVDVTGSLVCVVPPDSSLPGFRIVGLPDTGK